MADTKLDRLKSQLMTSGLQQKDNALFQVINQLIDFLRIISISASTNSTAIAGNFASKNSDFLTWSDQASSLPNSRNLIAGSGITFDDTIINERTIASVGGAEWSVLTNGSIEYPELIFADGDVIMTHIP